MSEYSAQNIAVFQRKILSWYQEHQRDFPWRKTRDPYLILLSEIMSQQTQIIRVIPKYETWLETFPTIEVLANAPVSEVLRYWSGLGYNRRALNLKKTAQIIAEQYNGKFPQTEKELLALPGIGAYTARAVLCFAFNHQVAVVDTNVRKVIVTEFLERHSGKPKVHPESQNAEQESSRDSGQARMTNKEISNIAEQLLPQGKAYEWNQALMDYAGAMLKQHKIPIPKQSKFIGSHRYYRGQVLKQLLEKKQIKMQEVGKIIKKDYSEKDEALIEKVVGELVKEGFVVIKKKTLMLSS